MACSGVSFGGFEGDLGSGEQMAVCVTATHEMTPALGELTTDNGLGSNIGMLDEYTMGHLLSFLPMGDLKNCRLVNSCWNQASIREIKKREYLIEFSEHKDDHGIEDIPRLIQLIQSSAQFPWTKFNVGGGIVKTDEDKKQIVNLFREIAHFATEIYLHNFNPEIEFPEDVEFPELLALTVQYLGNKIPMERNRKHGLRIVEQAQKLDDLFLFGFETPMFMAILETPNCRKITRLSISSKIEAENLLELSGMGFRLKYLYILLFSLSNVTADSLQTFLQSQSSCLEELELITSHPLKLQCPRMDKLKVLVVSCAQLYSEVSYKNQFPALKKLLFGVQRSDDLDSFFNDEIDPVETVEELDFDICYHPPGRILQAARQFPKLRKITLRANQNMVSCLGHSMLHLKEVCLQVMGSDDLDAILTGFSQDVESLKDLPSSQLDMLERNREPLPFLKNLTKLRLEPAWNNQPALRFSDFSCRFALMKMEHLRILEISGECNQISEPVMEAMKNKFTVRLEP